MQGLTIDRVVLKPTITIHQVHEVITMDLEVDWLYYVKTTNGHKFTARYLGRDTRGRAVFQSSKGHTSWLSNSKIETVVPLRKL
jgi:hypothetical protein